MQYKYPPYCSLCRRITICFAHSLCIESSFFIFISILLAVLTRSPHGEPYSFTCSSSIYLNCLFPQLHRGGLSNVRPERVQAETAGFSAANSLFFIFLSHWRWSRFCFFFFAYMMELVYEGAGLQRRITAGRTVARLFSVIPGGTSFTLLGEKKKRKEKLPQFNRSYFGNVSINWTGMQSGTRQFKVRAPPLIGFVNSHVKRKQAVEFFWAR